MRKLSKITESIWGDIRKKSLGQEERVENAVNTLSKDEFYDYINDHYEVRERNHSDPGNLGTIRRVDTFGLINIPLITYKDAVFTLCIQYTTSKDEMYRLFIPTGKYLLSECKDFIEDLNNNFIIKNDDPGQITFGEFSNEIIIRIIELVISKYKDISILVKK